MTIDRNRDIAGQTLHASENTATRILFAVWMIESLQVHKTSLAELVQLSDELTLPLNILD